MEHIYPRVHNRKASVDVWELENPVLLDGEVILVADGSDIRVKVGDGVTEYRRLNFIDDDIRDSIEGKLSADLSPSDAGKVLGINESGEVVPVEVNIGDVSKPLTWGSFLESPK